MALFAYLTNLRKSSAYIIGSVIGMLLIPAIIAFFVSRRSGLRDWNSFSKWLFWGGVVVSILSLSGARNQPADPDDTTAKSLIQQAANREVDPDASESKKYGLKFLGDILQLTREHQETVGKCGPILEGLMSAESFASPGAMQNTANGFRECTESDSAYFAEILKRYSAVRAEVAAKDWPAAEKEAFLRGFDESSAGPLRNITNQDKVEKLWAEAALDLYGFALKNSRSFAAHNGRLVIRDENVRQVFNQKSARYEDLRKNLASIQSQMEANRDATLKDQGVTMEDLKLKK
ncbi:MAG: hypothetical protein HYX26_03075 [Acidobacteriales bacterium]|nr:hypothetical protein [Terriglobales bacterium]